MPGFPTHALHGTDHKNLHCCVSPRLKGDQLRLLDTIANRELLPPSELNRVSRSDTKDDSEASTVQPQVDGEEKCLPMNQLDAPITLFNFLSEATLCHEMRSNLQSQFDSWSHAALKCRIHRFQRYAHEVRENMETTILVGGPFLVNHQCMMAVFALMKYDSDAPDGYRYNVMSSFFCLMVELSHGPCPGVPQSI